MGSFLVNRSKWEKSAYMSIYTLSSNICPFKKTYPIFHKIIQETNFDMGYIEVV
jgi:hypothetical protein